MGLVVVFLGFGAILGSSPEAKEQTKDRRAIDLCWQEQKRKSFDAGTQRFIAGACEKMETEFTKKHGQRP